MSAPAAERAYGLIFERHTEVFLLTGRRPSISGKVLIDGDKTATVHTVQAIAGQHATVGNGSRHPVGQLIAVSESDDVTPTGLKKLSEVRRGAPDAPVHTIINGENYHALEALQYTHAGKVDLIYIDPPYNTGNADWKYNDRYVDSKDGYRHSKWLSFMEKRLLIAKQLLTPTGVVIMAIDDNEHHRLRMLADQVFGEGNFLSNVTWQGNKKNDARFDGGGADYMVTYARDKESIVQTGRRWRERKAGVDQILAAGEDAWQKSSHDEHRATELLKAWWKTVPSESPTRSSKHYSSVDENGKVYFAGPIDFPGGGGPRYDVLHPVSGKPVPVPSRGWGAREETLRRWISEGRVKFGTDETSRINRKQYLHEIDSETVLPTFTSDRRAATRHLESLLGDKRFPFPKDHKVLMRWFRMVAPADAVILDFFGGSGTTAEAVIRLNAEDGGTRQTILVTNNELSKKDDAALRKAGHTPGDDAYEALGVFHHVTKPRLETVVTGVREDGSKYSDGLDANVAFFELTYLDEPEIEEPPA